MALRLIVAIGGALALVIGLSCAGRSSGSVTESASTVAPHVQKAWNRNLATLQRITAGKTFDQQEYVSAVEFFERITGLNADDNKSFVGRLPNENLKSDLERWQEWFSKKADQLEWDPETNTVIRAGV